MCPACISSAAIVVVGLTSTSGVALVIKLLGKGPKASGRSKREGSNENIKTK